MLAPVSIIYEAETVKGKKVQFAKQHEHKDLVESWAVTDGHDHLYYKSIFNSKLV